MWQTDPIHQANSGPCQERTGDSRVAMSCELFTIEVIQYRLLVGTVVVTVRVTFTLQNTTIEPR